jgi:hypothetical protein
MDDANSVFEIDPNVNKMFEMEWSSEHEMILIDWADKAMCYRWLHSQANHKYMTASRFFTIPVIIISTLTGTANFAQDRVPPSFVDTFVMIVGAMNLIAGIITTIQQFLKINELNEAHRVSSIAWDKFYRNIKIELAKNPNERIPVGQMIKMCKEEFDRLMETSPVINDNIIQKFKVTFKNTPAFSKIRKPEICDELTSTIDFVYNKKKDVKQDSKLKMIASKMVETRKTQQKVFDVIQQFKVLHNRDPTEEELNDSIMANDEFKTMRRDYIESAIEKYYNGELEKELQMPQKSNIFKTLAQKSIQSPVIDTGNTIMSKFGTAIKKAQQNIENKLESTQNENGLQIVIDNETSDDTASNDI